jgi:hypothetical protein
MMHDKTPLLLRTPIGLLRDWHYWNSFVGFASLHDIHYEEGVSNRRSHPSLCDLTWGEPHASIDCGHT